MFEFDNQNSYLIVNKEQPGELGYVQVVQTLVESIHNWSSSTRISPLIPLKHVYYSGLNSYSFEGECYLYFIGLTSPESLPNFTTDVSKHLWLTLGIFNILLCLSDHKDVEVLYQWLEEKNKIYERWHINNQKIIKINYSPKNEIQLNSDLEKITNLFTEVKPQNELFITLNDFLPTMASILTKCERDANFLTPDLIKTVEVVEKLIVDYNENDKHEVCSRLIGQFIYTNSGLAHFASQALAGTTKILDSGSHFSAYSLLGLGLPSIALWRICKFVNDTLGKARIPTLVSTFKEFSHDIPRLTELSSTDSYWENDFLGDAIDYLKKHHITEEPVVPLITHFSSRDGFRSYLTTISAPLSCITSCNTTAWSLLTLTHEISHIVIKGVLGHLLPDLDSDEEMADACRLLATDGNRSNLLLELRSYLLTAIIMLYEAGDEEQNPPINVAELSKEELREIIDSWHHEVEEIFAHTFDFLYFYGRDVNKYVTSLWWSWGTVPNVHSRIRNYVIRTVCALYSQQASRGLKGIEIAINQTQDALREMIGLQGDSGYLNKALEFTKEPKSDEIARLLQSRSMLVNIVNRFLFSDKIATVLRSETAVTSGAAEKEGYNLHPRKLENINISNPITFIENFSHSKEPSTSVSAWIYAVLALYTDGIK
jgi:hypothetical protein